MVSKKGVFFIFLLYSFNLCSQEAYLMGFVKDSLQNPLSFANIIAKPKDTTKNLTFVISDEEGRYSLSLKKNNTYTISISYLGFETLDYNITPTQNTSKNFVLKEAKNQLDEVIIELPVTVKQDTIIYNTKYFVTGRRA